MVDLEDIKRAAYVGTDEQGRPVAHIPLELWEAWMTQELRPQNARLLALLDEWDANPDDTPAEWWDDFQAFLKANRLDLSS
ncbi:MAG: hypothetical protein IT326_09125, partial [Anaerolineae bacterium]|nr:hypothetical protein [Anaerolineae bacterium]